MEILHWIVVAIVASVAACRASKKIYILNRIYFFLCRFRCLLQNTRFCSAVLVNSIFLFFLLSVNSIFSSIFRRVCVCEISRPFSFNCCFPLLSSLFTSKNNVCKENIDNLRNESILQKSCRIDFCPVRIIHCHHFDGSFVRLHACACPSMCAFISGLFGENMDDDIWKMVCSNIY